MLDWWPPRVGCPRSSDIRDPYSDDLPVPSVDHSRIFGPANSTDVDQADDQQGSGVSFRFAGISWSRFWDLDALTKFEQTLNTGDQSMELEDVADPAMLLRWVDA